MLFLTTIYKDDARPVTWRYHVSIIRVNLFDTYSWHIWTSFVDMKTKFKLSGQRASYRKIYQNKTLTEKLKSSYSSSLFVQTKICIFVISNTPFWVYVLLLLSLSSVKLKKTKFLFNKSFIICHTHLQT